MASLENNQSGLMLTKQWHENADGGMDFSYWLATAQGARKCVIKNQQSVFFLTDADVKNAKRLLIPAHGHQTITSIVFKALPLKDFNYQAITAVYFESQNALYQNKQTLAKFDIYPLEADFQPQHRYLMERFITGFAQLNAAHHLEKAKPSAIKLTITSLDIETAMVGKQLFSIALTTKTWPDNVIRQRHVMVVNNEKWSGTDRAYAQSEDYLHVYDSETELLNQFIKVMQHIDPDIVIGWAVVGFDLRFLQGRCDALGIDLTIGRDNTAIKWRQSFDDKEHYTAFLQGRVVLDGISTLKSATWQFESFALDNVANELLERGKKIDHSKVDNRGWEITRMYNEDLKSFALYNLEDCILVEDIFEKADLFNFAIQRAEMTGLNMDRAGGSVAAFDFRYLPLLHRQGFIAPNLAVEPEGVGSPGGYVFESTPGIYENVIVLDFKSLYPSIIRSFKIDPLALTMAVNELGIEKKRDLISRHLDDLNRYSPGFNHAAFLKEKAILPQLIDELWQQRDIAKKDKNAALSQAVKILMNSFYGVMGTPGCRFFDYRLPSSITLRGHQILNQTKQWLEAQGHQVIYGDTDSVFVHIKPEGSNNSIDDIALSLKDGLNAWWTAFLQQEYQLQSHLEIEYETHFRQFLMPTIRGTDKGSKKRYAGIIQTETGASELIFKGLEAVRTDWTVMAREFQTELYRKIFAGEEWIDWVKAQIAALKAGQFDDKLIYRKRLRRKVDEYQKNIPPHVQAALHANQACNAQGKAAPYQHRGWISYVLTQGGPQTLPFQTSPLAYEDYLERQIEPIVDGIAHFMGSSFEKITSQQMDLF